MNLISEYMDKAPAYINRIFKNSAGRSIQNHIDEVRLKKSLKFLKESSMSIKEISNSIGMANEKYFYVLFKKKMGQTPSDFRNRK